ncbi:hypothetical protein EDB80DRAFT_165068 [Ilyonectria destructans]|nr:hypothetical protein EDB80DRAFT_165068 [Ilyonectria destructans]
MESTLVVTTSILALASTSGALTTSLLSLKRDLTRAPAAHYSLLREVAVLRDIVDECTHTLDGLSQVPVHIRQTLISCFEAGEKVHILLEMRKFVSPRVGAADFPGWLPAFKLYTYSREKDLAGEVSQFRERVYLLRDMCSEIKTGSQLLEASAAIFKLMSLTEHESHLTRAELETLRKRMSERDQNGWTDHDDDITHGGGLSRSNSESEFEALNAAQKPSEATETNKTNGILLRNRRQPLAEQVMALVKSNYIVDATVLVENSTKHGGRRFNQAPANVQYYPGRVKLDTGSEADLASLQYLLDAGLNKDDLTPIPVANQC